MLKRLVYAIVVPSASVCFGIGYMKLQYTSTMRPPAKDASSLDPKKERRIAVIGAGVIGLTTAYYLAQNPLNKIVVIERHNKPYQETSFQNGCYFHTQNCESWINKPFKKFLETCYKKDHFSQTYLLSMLRDPLTAIKFGYLWLFQQPDLDSYAKIILPLLAGSEERLRQYLAKEGVTKEQVGYRPDTLQYMLQKDGDFSIYQRNIDYEKNPQTLIEREKDPARYQSDVIEKLQFAKPIADQFTYALIRKCPTLNTAWFCESLYQNLSKKDNVTFKLGSFLSGYQISTEKSKKGHVESVVLNYRDKIAVDDIVLCVGPQARVHVQEHFNTVFP